MGAWNADTQSWDEEPGWFARLRERIFRTPNVQRNRSLGWRLWFNKYGGFSRPFPDRAAAEAAKKRIVAGEDLKAEFWGPAPAPAPSVAPSSMGLVAVLDVAFVRKNRAFLEATSALPELFHRRSGCALVLREPREVRFFGDRSIAQRGLSVNGHRVDGIEAWNDGWHGYFSDDVDVTHVAEGSRER